MAEEGYQETLEPLRRRSARYALTELVLRFRLGEGNAGESVYVEKHGPGVVLVSRGRSARRAGSRCSSWLTDVVKNPLHRGCFGDEGDNAHFCPALWAAQGGRLVDAV